MNTEITLVKKNWEKPTLIEISKTTILGPGGSQGDSQDFKVKS